MGNLHRFKNFDFYGRDHLFSHLSKAGNYDAIREILNIPDWFREKMKFDPSGNSFSSDVRVGIYLSGLDRSKLGDYIYYNFILARLGSTANLFPPDALVFMVKMGQGEQAQKRANLITEPYSKIFSLSQIASTYYDIGNRYESTEIFKVVDEHINRLPRGDTRDRSSLVFAANMAKTDLVERVPDIVSSIENWEYRQRAYAEVVASLVEKGALLSAKKLIDVIESDDLSLISILRIQAAMMQDEEENSLLEQAERISRQIDFKEVPIERIAQITALFYQIGEASLADHISLNYLDNAWRIRSLRMLAASGFPDLAHEIFTNLLPSLREGGEPGEFAQLYAIWGDREKSKDYIRQDELRGNTRTAWGGAIWRFGDRQEFDYAITLLDNIPDIKHKLWTISGLGQSALANGKYETSEKLFQMIEQEASWIPEKINLSIPFKTIHYYKSVVENADSSTHEYLEEGGGNFLCSILAEQRDYSTLHRIALRLHNIDHQVHNLRLVIRHYLETGQLDLAHEIITEVGSSAHDSLLTEIIRAHLQLGEIERAEVLIPQLIKRKQVDIAWMDLARTMAEKGEYLAAAKYHQNILSKRIKDQACGEISISAATNSDFSIAFDYLGKIKNEKIQARSKASIAVNRFLGGFEESAEQLLAEIKFSQEHRNAILILSKSLMDNGDFDRAFKLIDTLAKSKYHFSAIVGLLQISKFAPDHLEIVLNHYQGKFEEEILDAEFHIYLELQKYDLVNQVMDKLGNTSNAYKYYRRLIESLIKNDRLEEGLLLLQTKIDPAAQSAIFASSSTILAEKGKISEAINLWENILGSLYIERARKDIQFYALVHQLKKPDELFSTLKSVFSTSQRGGWEQLTSCLQDFSFAIGVLLTDKEINGLLPRIQRLENQ